MAPSYLGHSRNRQGIIVAVFVRMTLFHAVNVGA